MWSWTDSHLSAVSPNRLLWSWPMRSPWVPFCMHRLPQADHWTARDGFMVSGFSRPKQAQIHEHVLTTDGPLITAHCSIPPDPIPSHHRQRFPRASHANCAAASWKSACLARSLSSDGLPSLRTQHTLLKGKSPLSGQKDHNGC